MRRISRSCLQRSRRERKKTQVILSIFTKCNSKKETNVCCRTSSNTTNKEQTKTKQQTEHKTKKNTKQTKKDETKHDEPKPDSKTSKTLQGSKPGQRTTRTKPTKPINKISFKIRKSWPQGESKDSKALAEWSRKNDSRQSISEPGDTKQCSTYEDMYDK